MSFKKIEDIQYLYENIDSREEELVELLNVLEEHLKESGYSDKAIECFIETANVHDVESHIQLSSLDEGAKTKLLKKLGTGAWNLIKNQGRRLKNVVKRNTPVSTRKGIKDKIKNTKDTVTKTGDKVKNAIKNNPVKSSIAGAGALTVGALATGGSGKDDSNKDTPAKPGYFKDAQGKEFPTTDTIRGTTRKVDPEKPIKALRIATQKNKPDGLARVIAGTADAITGNMTDFDQRGGKPKGLSRVMGGVADIATQGLTDLDKRGGKPWGMGRVVAGAADKLTGDRTDFDKRGVSKLNKGQEKLYEPKKVETPKVDTPKDKDPLSWKNMKDSGLLDKPIVTPKVDTPKVDPPKVDTPKPVKMHSLEKKNRARFGDDAIDKLKAKQVDFKKMQSKDMSKDDFIKKYPKSITAQKAAGLRDHFDAFDIVLGYLEETQQADSLDEALYIMMEMDAATIQGIVRDSEFITEEEYDRQKDRQLERGGAGAGDGDNPSTRKPNYGSKQTDAQKKKSQENSKKAFNTVVDRLRNKYGNNAIVTNSHLKTAKKKKEEAKNK